jgi:hypothetical protein
MKHVNIDYRYERKYKIVAKRLLWLYVVGQRRFHQNQNQKNRGNNNSGNNNNQHRKDK